VHCGCVVVYASDLTRLAETTTTALQSPYIFSPSSPPPPPPQAPHTHSETPTNPTYNHSLPTRPGRGLLLRPWAYCSVGQPFCGSASASIETPPPAMAALPLAPTPWSVTASPGTDNHTLRPPHLSACGGAVAGSDVCLGTVSRFRRRPLSREG